MCLSILAKFIVYQWYTREHYKQAKIIVPCLQSFVLGNLEFLSQILRKLQASKFDTFLQEITVKIPHTSILLHLDTFNELENVVKVNVL